MASALPIPQFPQPGFLLADERTASTFEEIPIINVSAAFTDDHAARRALADDILDASINVGFFYLKDHGIPEEAFWATVEAGKRFFALPECQKLELDIHKSASYKGYTALLAENTDVTANGDLHEAFDIGYEPKDQTLASESAKDVDSVMGGANVWPKDILGFKDAFLDYYHAALNLAQRLFPIFALALGLPENWFDDKTTRPAAIMRLLHYPPQDVASAEKQIGIGAHTDYECFTILWQDSNGGLQVQNTGGKWIDAVPIPGTVVVNLGDQFTRWTNDVFKSTPHRVINRSGRERYSIPVFIGTDYDTMLDPIETCVLPGSPPHYEVMTAGDYVKSRLDATYTRSAQVID